ncbi:hypothetical protein L9F63_003426, partial [Diploptera punctata]
NMLMQLTVAYRHREIEEEILSAADLKSIFDTDKPDAELGARIEQLGNDFKPFIPLGRSLLAKMAVYQLWVDHLAPRLIDAGIRLKDGRSNPAFRTAFSEELRASAEANGIILDELRKLADDSKRLTDMVVQISESLKTKKDKED